MALFLTLILMFAHSGDKESTKYFILLPSVWMFVCTSVFMCVQVHVCECQRPTLVVILTNTVYIF